MSLYSDYLKETKQREIIETGTGFVTYKIMGQECYIIDVFVAEAFRKSGLCAEFGEAVAKIAKEKGCKYLSASVNTTIADPTSSMKMLLALGYRIVRADTQMIWLRKEL